MNRRSGSTSRHGPAFLDICAISSPRPASPTCGRPICSTRSYPATMWSSYTTVVCSPPEPRPPSSPHSARPTLPAPSPNSSARIQCQPGMLRRDHRPRRRQARWAVRRSATGVHPPSVYDLPEGCRLARGAALSPSTRPLRLRAGPTTRLALDLRRGLPQRARRLDHPALRDLCPLRGVHHARACRDDTAVQRHAVVTVHGLRSRDGQYAHPPRKSAAPLVHPHCQAAGRDSCLGYPGLHLSACRLVLGNRAPTPWLYHGPAGPHPRGHDAWLAWHAAFLDDQAAREFCWCHELRDLPDVLRLFGAL